MSLTPDDIFAGHFDENPIEIEDAVIISESSNLPELAGIDDAEIMQVWPKLKLNVIEIHVNEETQYEVTRYRKDLGALSKHIEKVRKEKIKLLKLQIIKIEEPYKNLFTVVNELLAGLKKSFTVFQIAQQAIADEKAAKEREEKAAVLRKIADEKQALADAQADSEDAAEKKRYQAAQDELAEKKQEIESTEIVVQKTKVQAMSATAFLQETWKYTIDNEDVIPKGFPLALLKYDRAKINKVVKSEKEKAVGKYPGITVFPEKDSRIR